MFIFELFIVQISVKKNEAICQYQQMFLLYRISC